MLRLVLLLSSGTIRLGLLLRLALAGTTLKAGTTRLALLLGLVLL